MIRLSPLRKVVWYLGEKGLGPTYRIIRLVEKGQKSWDLDQPPSPATGAGPRASSELPAVAAAAGKDPEARRSASAKKEFSSADSAQSGQRRAVSVEFQIVCVVFVCVSFVLCSCILCV